jgi:hypothetical protein
MPRRGERHPRPAAKAPERGRQLSRIGTRELVYINPKGTSMRHVIHPGNFRCSQLVAQLADAWIAHHRATALTNSQAYTRVIRLFGEFTDGYLAARGLEPAEARLDGTVIDLTEVIFAFEKDLQDRYPSDSPRPHVLAATLLLLINHHASRDPKVPERLRRRAEGSPTFRRAAGKPLDEFTNAERLAMQEAAKADIRALEKRLARGQALLAEGADPRQGGWESLANLVWAARHRILTTDALQANLPDRLDRWPEPLKELAGSPEGITSRSWLNLMLAVNGFLFPAEIDLQPFRILLLLQMTDCTPEELHVLELDDVQFSKEGVRVVQRKRRAGRVRADFHLAEDRPLAEGEQPGERAYPGTGNWDVPGLLRRLVGVTAGIREVFDAPPRLFIAVESADYRKRVDARFARFTINGRRFMDWIALHDGSDGTPALKVSAPYDVRRLRKTAKTLKVAALGGTLSDLAGDDHHIEVFAGHYAHGTTAHVLAGKAINRAQKQVFSRLSGKPLLVTAQAEAQLTQPEAKQALGLTDDQAEALVSGELNMGLTNCRNPYNSPHTPEGKLCHVAPAMCLLCRNAVVFTSQLPQLLLLSDHIERMRLVLTPPRWTAVWGRQAAALGEVFAECADLIPAARAEIEEKKLRLDLPLGMRTEYDR